MVFVKKVQTGQGQVFRNMDAFEEAMVASSAQGAEAAEAPANPAIEEYLKSWGLSMYIDKFKDGRMVQKNPFSFYGLLWGIFNFFYLFFQTLTNANFNKLGDEYGRDMSRPGGGPSKPPSKRFGGFSSGSGPAPPPAGGCGCG